MIHRFAPFTEAAARCTPWAATLMVDIAAKLPNVDAHRPDDALAIAVIPRANVVPVFHFVVEDDELRERARELIAEHNNSITNTPGPDTVLIVCPLY